MPDTQLFTVEAAFALADEFKTALALSKLRLIKAPFTLSAFSTKVQMVASEATFDGYVTGGYALTAWTGPDNSNVGGKVITSPMVNVTYGPAEDPPVSNEIVAWWIEDASGDVRTAGRFDPPRMMQSVGDAIKFIDQMVMGRNPTPAVEE